MGLYYSWGNVEGYSEGSGYDFSQEVYNASPGATIAADLTLGQDAARVELGAPWRMPTSAEFQELYNYCTSVWTRLNGVYGRLFTSNANGKTLFLPAAGRYDGTSLDRLGSRGDYWSSTFHSSTNAYYLSIDSESADPHNNSFRRFGFTVRAVMDP